MVDFLKELANAAQKGFNDAANSFLNALRKPIDDLEAFFRQIEDEINKIIEEIEKFTGKIKKVFDKLGEDMERSFENMGEALSDMMKICVTYDNIKYCYGIDDVIEDMRRFVCMLGTLPNRIDNIFAGIGNIIDGSTSEIRIAFEELGYVFEETQVFFEYSSLYLGTYLACLVKFIINFYKCFFYYLVEFIGKIFYLPVLFGMWLIGTFIGIDMKPTEQRVWKGLSYFDGIIFVMLGFHIIHFPRHVRKDCYTCVRLRSRVVEDQGTKVAKAWGGENDLPPEQKDRDEVRRKWNRGYKNFAEVTAFPEARPSTRIK
jgi:hypothetical protein